MKVILLYLIPAALTLRFTFGYQVAESRRDWGTVDAEELIPMSLLSVLAGLLWPLMLIGLAIWNAADSYAKKVNQQ